MRYLYYILGIFILITAAFGYLLLDEPEVDVSKPAIAVNDRIITQSELERRMREKPHDKQKEAFMDSLITRELLIQEALRRGINQEESFRAAVEDFYEQSLIKILLDRKYKEFNPRVREAEIRRYKELSGHEVYLTKKRYSSPSAADAGKPEKSESINSPFAFLSESLRFHLLSLDPGQSTRPIATDKGFAVYTLEKLEKLKQAPGASDSNRDRIKSLIAEQKKELRYEQWTDKLKEQASIWRRK
ncbi:MAG: hypothetical protein R6X08_13165 [Desulfosalsimonadaceae bacterium]